MTESLHFGSHCLDLIPSPATDSCVTLADLLTSLTLTFSTCKMGTIIALLPSVHTP